MLRLVFERAKLVPNPFISQGGLMPRKLTVRPGEFPSIFVGKRETFAFRLSGNAMIVQRASATARCSTAGLESHHQIMAPE